MNDPFWRGITLTIVLTLLTSVLSLLLGVLAGAFKLSEHRLMRWAASLHIEIHRGVPALVLLIFWAFAFPRVFPLPLRTRLFFDNYLIDGIRVLTGLAVPYYFLASVVALTLNTSAYLAEFFRAGVGTLPQEYLEAAQTLGANRREVLFRIVIPQGLRAAFPAISTRLIHNLKNTALAALVSTPEFFHSIQTAISQSFRAVELLLLATVVYLVLSGAFALLLRWIDSALNRGPGKPGEHTGHPPSTPFMPQARLEEM